MELEDLKISWQNSINHNIEINKKDMEQLQIILSKKTAGSLTGLKKKYEKIISYLLIGMLFNILMQPFLHFILGEEGPVFRVTYGGLLSLIVLLLICISVVLYYWIRYININDSVDGPNLELSLRQNIKHLRKSFKQEMIFIPSIFLVLFVVARASSQFLGHGDFWDIAHTDIILALTTGVLCFVFYISRRFSFYRKHINELEGYLAEYSQKLQ